jgi:hypothetical protein
MSDLQTVRAWNGRIYRRTRVQRQLRRERKKWTYDFEREETALCSESRQER